MLVQATDIIAAAKEFADAEDPNAGAWIGPATWQRWLDRRYRVLYDRFLFTGAVTPLPIDTTFSYNPTTGYMSLPSANARALVDVFRVIGSGSGAVYEPLDCAQAKSQYPNLDLMRTVPSPWFAGAMYPYGRTGRSWAAFTAPDATVRIQVSPHDIADTYLVRSVADPDTSGGYWMPPEGEEWIALGMAGRAAAKEGVLSQAFLRLSAAADDELQAYLDNARLKHARKVSLSPHDGRSYGSWGDPSRWWWRP